MVRLSYLHSCGQESEGQVKGHMPGSYILDEMAARGWTIERLAEKMGYPKTRVTPVKRIICGEPVTPEIAQRLSKAFSTSARLWLNLEDAWQKAGGR